MARRHFFGLDPEEPTIFVLFTFFKTFEITSFCPIMKMTEPKSSELLEIHFGGFKVKEWKKFLIHLFLLSHEQALYISRLACYACPVYIYFSGRTRVNAKTPPEKNDE